MMEQISLGAAYAERRVEEATEEAARAVISRQAGDPWAVRRYGV